MNNRYVILSNGKVWSEKSKKFLKPFTLGKSTKQFYVEMNGKRENLGKLMYVKYCGKLPKKKCVGFKDITKPVLDAKNLVALTRGEQNKRYRTRKPFYSFNVPGSKKQFRVAIKVRGKVKTFGYFKTEEEATKCYCKLVDMGY